MGTLSTSSAVMVTTRPPPMLRAEGDVGSRSTPGLVRNRGRRRDGRGIRATHGFDETVVGRDAGIGVGAATDRVLAEDRHDVESAVFPDLVIFGKSRVRVTRVHGHDGRWHSTTSVSLQHCSRRRAGGSDTNSSRRSCRRHRRRCTSVHTSRDRPPGRCHRRDVEAKSCSS